MQLEKGMRDTQYPLQHSLEGCQHSVATVFNSNAYRALVLYQHPYPMRSVFGELLHDLGEVDCGKEISP